MPSGHKKEAIKALRSRYGGAWNVKIIPVGVELEREVSAELMQHVFFNFVRDDMLGLRLQPALAVTFVAVNTARDAISPRHQYTVDPVTGFLFLNSVIDKNLRQLGGGLFEADMPLQPALNNFLTFVDDSINNSRFYDSLLSIDDYIAAIETQRWEFITVMPAYLYALIAKGQIEKAKRLATEQKKLVIQIGIERGFVQRANNTQEYDEILAMADN